MVPKLTISNLITKTARVVGRRYQRECAPLGITAPQAGVVWALAEAGPKSQVELTEFLHLEKTNVNTMVKKLVDAEIVTLRKVPEDARKTLVCLTAKGKRLSKKLYKVDADVSARITDLIDNKSDEQIIRTFLERIFYGG